MSSAQVEATPSALINATTIKLDAAIRFDGAVKFDAAIKPDGTTKFGAAIKLQPSNLTAPPVGGERRRWLSMSSPLCHQLSHQCHNHQT